MPSARANEMRTIIDDCEMQRPPTVGYAGNQPSKSVNSGLQYIKCFFAGAITSGSLIFLLIKAFGG